MDNTQYAKKLFEIIKSNPNPGVEKRMKHKRVEIKKFLIEQNLDESNDSELIHDIACFSEVGYSMRQIIVEPLVTTIHLDNGNIYDFSLTAFNSVPFPYDVICIRKNNDGEFNDIVFIFDIAILIGGCINNFKVEYKGERYYG
jgi:hypothetical protein